MGMPPRIKVTGVEAADQVTAELAVALRDGGMGERAAIEEAQRIRDAYRDAFSKAWLLLRDYGADGGEILLGAYPSREAAQGGAREHSSGGADPDWSEESPWPGQAYIHATDHDGGGEFEVRPFEIRWDD